jgi:hypothetical protein
MVKHAIEAQTPLILSGNNWIEMTIRRPLKYNEGPITPVVIVDGTTAEERQCDVKQSITIEIAPSGKGKLQSCVCRPNEAFPFGVGVCASSVSKAKSLAICELQFWMSLQEEGHRILLGGGQLEAVLALR